MRVNTRYINSTRGTSSNSYLINLIILPKFDLLNACGIWTSLRALRLWISHTCRSDSFACYPRFPLNGIKKYLTWSDLTWQTDTLFAATVIDFCCLTSTEARRSIRDGDEWERRTEEWNLETGANPEDQGCRGPRHGSASDCFMPTFPGSSRVTSFRLPCLNPGNGSECTRVTCCERESVGDVQPRIQMCVAVSPPWLHTSRVRG